MYDMHTHTEFSEDGSYPMKQMAQTAFDKGLKGICFTDHFDLDYPSPGNQFPYDYNRYIKEIKSSRKIFDAYENGEFEVFSGIEMGLQPQVLKHCSDFLRNKQYDFIIGSMHVIKGVDMYTSAYRKLGNSELLINYYFEDLYNCVKEYDEFSVLGHLDVIRRYLHKKDRDYDFEKEKEKLAEIFKILIKKGKGIEVNTSGLRYNLDSSTPGPKAIKLFKDLGGEIVTLSSDAHRPQDIGFMFSEAAEMLKGIGFEYGCYFKNLQPIFYKL